MSSVINDQPSPVMDSLLTGSAGVAPPLHIREHLWAASASVSRMLLEATDVMAVMPDVLRELGLAAQVERTALAMAEEDAEGRRWLELKCEWLAEGVFDGLTTNTLPAWMARRSDCFCNQLKSGHAVYLCKDDLTDATQTSIASRKAQSSILVPILVNNKYMGVLGFDACLQSREFDPAVVSALEIAAGVIGAALHREQLVATITHERAQVAEQRVAELARSNATLRANLQRLASAPDIRSFLSDVLLETTQQLNAAVGMALMLSVDSAEWQVKALVRDGRMEEPDFPSTTPHRNDRPLPFVDSAVGYCAMEMSDESDEDMFWPELVDYHRRQQHRCMYVLPMMYGEDLVGYITLAFHHADALGAHHKEALAALGQQVTLALGLKRLAISAKNAAVLGERNRISREIHDGLAQAFTGILMQLGAVEEQADGNVLQETFGKIRDIAREGLAEARRSVMALQPVGTRAGGLELALRQLAERNTIPGRVRAYFDGQSTNQGNEHGAATGLAPECEHALLRIAQEAVTNALRHAQAQTICIALRNENNVVTLRISDDGCGMDVAIEHNPQGFGLTNMRERALAMGGAWELHSQPGDGTHIYVSIPLRT